jgi:hypothetical protein
MSLRSITAARYVTPLREGGSLPAVIEGDDDGLYVLKFRGAGQGPKALVAELVAGEIARALGLPMPELVFVDLDPELARTEPDPEIQQLIKDSAGLNLALDYLPGSINFDPVAEQVDGALASEVVWFDAFVSNVDRSFRNPNLLIWHRKPWLIDHGAALYFHHGWDGSPSHAGSAFPMIREHVLLARADDIAGADARLAPKLAREDFAAIMAMVPDAWLVGADTPADPAEHRAAYVEHFMQRLAQRQRFVEEAVNARA